MSATHKPTTDDVRIREIKEVIPPSRINAELAASTGAMENIVATRTDIHRILNGMDDRLLLIIGPCSIHDPKAALEYAQRLMAQKQRLADDILIVMRVYFEKPRTSVGWKGLINDPHLNGSFSINEGLRLARRTLLEINELGMPAGTEFLDVVTPQYTADLVSWGAIGARTTESQIHRELASGLSCPVGFKNGTDGNIKIAVDAIKAAAGAHHFLAVTKAGHSAIVSTAGNEDCHLILRGGKTPNYDAASVNNACAELTNAGLAPRVMIDCSHANSNKQFKRQIDVAADVATQLAAGDRRIFGLMVESHLHEGSQELEAGCALEYGKSITDPCLGWEDTVVLLDTLAQGVRARREAR
ncbi:MAG: 3-deoxy-7-phosphoheptulonate synthase AroG [Methylobacillus sp.]|jgi:3-deoxy-7-phosphoheptulonate synthase|nr:3-deoxy-7-phosphoheptulonate synthase AroG [Methylobacillus sp.]